MTTKRGFTLVELMVALGIFSIVVLLASGAYLMMISIARKSQGVSTGIDNLTFALEIMTRNIRTGTDYACGSGGDCAIVPGDSFSFRNSSGVLVEYRLSNSVLVENKGGIERPLTDASVGISALNFYVVGTEQTPIDYRQPHVLIVVAGRVSSDARTQDNFYVQTSATMRGSDIGI